MLRTRTTARRYDSLDQFYEDPERWRSSERDLGLRWVGADGVTYRAAWIARTEEIYCVRYRTPDGKGGTVEVIGSLPAAAVDRGLAGWSAVCGQPESYEWLRRRVRRAPGARRPLTGNAAACIGTPPRASRSRTA
jgi:hypothetical protein